MKHNLYQSKNRLEKASAMQKSTSKFERSKNNLNVEVTYLNIVIRTYKEIMFHQSRFTDILKRDYPEVRKEVLEKTIKEFGKGRRKKEIIEEEINKIANSPKGLFLKKRLKRRFNIK